MKATDEWQHESIVWKQACVTWQETSIGTLSYQDALKIVSKDKQNKPYGLSANAVFYISGVHLKNIATVVQAVSSASCFTSIFIAVLF